ncbi:MAG: hypothetical protein ACREL6_12805, partial [Gemmatimonadales bacterium]
NSSVWSPGRRTATQSLGEISRIGTIGRDGEDLKRASPIGMEGYPRPVGRPTGCAIIGRICGDPPKTGTVCRHHIYIIISALTIVKGKMSSVW